jgi:hypothetical protein
VQLRAQSAAPATLNSTGNTSIIGSNEFDWSVGEMTMVSTFATPGIVITQGVLQPSELQPTAVPVTGALTKQLQVFPTPATSVVNIKYSSPGQGFLSYKFMDMNGKMMKTQSLNVAMGTTVEQINVAELACATYMLEVTVNSENGAPESIVYKIQKTR